MRDLTLAEREQLELEAARAAFAAAREVRVRWGEDSFPTWEQAGDHRRQEVLCALAFHPELEAAVGVLEERVGRLRRIVGLDEEAA